MPRKSASLRISFISYGSAMLNEINQGDCYYDYGFFSRENNDNIFYNEILVV